MAETDILNPVQGYWAELGGNPTWNYDYTRKKANNRQQTSARLGPPNTRDVSNNGHAFTWNWVARPLSVVQRVEKFYDDFKDGYFTVIDYDNEGRHYVGRFLDAPNIQPIGNFTYTIQGLAFQEVQTARMLVYPSDFVNWGHPINVVDDFLNPRVAFMQGAWSIQVSPLAPAIASGSTPPVPAASMPSALEAYDAAAAVGDWAQISYVGWGFQMTLRQAANLGVCNIYLDDVIIITQLNLTDFTILSSDPRVSVLEFVGPNAVVVIQISVINVPLDMHRVKIVVDATSPAGQAMIFPAVTYIY